MDSVVQMLRQEPASLTPVSPRGKTKRMIEFVTAGAAVDVAVVLIQRVAH